MSLTHQKTVKQCVNYLNRIHHCIAFETPSTPHKRRKTNKTGISDIHCCLSGKFISIEVKLEGDRQRAEQREFQADVERCGGIYWIVESVGNLADEVKDYLIK